MDSYKKIRKKLESALDAERFEHTLGVAKTAQFMACLYGEDPDKAYLAGLLHDCAKNIPHKDKIKLCRNNGIELSEVELENPSLIHAKAGIVIARDEYKVDDPDILEAIGSHTTGLPDMSLLQKIIFIADYIEPGRPMRGGLNEIRFSAVNYSEEMALEKTIILIIENTLSYLKDSAKAIDPTTMETYNFYKKVIEEKTNE